MASRSESLPNKSHPFMSELDDHISRSKSCETTSTLSSTTITQKLSILIDLYDCIDKLLILPQTQQILSQALNKKCVDELLDGSLRILDICSSAKDALLQTKEYTSELQSRIRRRQGGQNGYSTEVRKYLTSRKMAQKTIQKVSNNLKGLDSKLWSIDNGYEYAIFMNKLREVQVVTLDVLRSFMSFISGSTKSQSKRNNWGLVSKIMLQKKIAISDEEETAVNEFAMADSALESLIGCSKFDSMENVQNRLKNLEICIQYFEEGSHNLFRRMIKTRVSLLNIFN